MTELLKTLNKIANQYECDVVAGNEFAYYYEENLIVVNINDNDETFLNFARKNGLNAGISIFTISFFHELGHNETIDFCNEYEGDKNELTPEEYFSLEEEFEATAWAIDFCNENKTLIEKIEKILKKIVDK